MLQERPDGATDSHGWSAELPGGWWDERLFARGGHFLQSSHWGAFQQALERPVFFGSGDGWQCLAILERSSRATRLYCPYGPVADNRDAYRTAIDAATEVAREHGALFVRVEPWAPLQPADLEALGHDPAFRPVQPSLTWVQDLTKPRDALFGEFSANNRNRFRSAPGKGLRIETSHDPADVPILLRMIHDVAAHTGITPHHDEYYRHQATVLLRRGAGTLYVARHRGEPVAAALAFDSPDTRYYAHSGSLLSARPLHPGGPMLATMILDAQERGQRVFDFVGAAPADRPDHPWAGFTRFKQSFGGRYRAYLGTWERGCSPLYRAYRALNDGTSHAAS